MLIGIDCSRAFGKFWGGPESYSYYLIRAIIQAGSRHQFRLYLPPNAQNNHRYKSFFSNLVSPSSSVILSEAKDLNSIDSSGRTPQNDERGKMTNKCELKTINWKRLWTQGGLALECFLNPPDVLFVPAHTLPILRRPGLKTVVTVHDLGAEFLPNYHKFPQKYYLNTMTEYAVKNATKIIAVSNYTKQDIIEKFSSGRHSSPRHSEGFGPKNLERIDPSRRVVQDDEGWGKKIHVIYEGYDRETFYPRGQAEIDFVKSKLGVEGEYFLFVGTIQPRKNLVRLIESFSVFSSRHSEVYEPKNLTLDPSGRTPQDDGVRRITLVLAGAAGWLNEEIYDAPKKFGVGDKVKFVGSVTREDLPALMSGAEAFVFPSLFEGFGLAPLEAMACGVPVIMSNVTSLPEVGGEAAFYVDPNSVSDIVSKMELMLSMSDSDRKIAVEKGLSQAQKFSWKKAALETLELIEAVAATSAR